MERQQTVICVEVCHLRSLSEFKFQLCVEKLILSQIKKYGPHFTSQAELLHVLPLKLRKA